MSTIRFKTSQGLTESILLPVAVLPSNPLSQDGSQDGLQFVHFDPRQHSNPIAIFEQINGELIVLAVGQNTSIKYKGQSVRSCVIHSMDTVHVNGEVLQVAANEELFPDVVPEQVGSPLIKDYADNIDVTNTFHPQDASKMENLSAPFEADQAETLMVAPEELLVSEPRPTTLNSNAFELVEDQPLLHPKRQASSYEEDEEEDEDENFVPPFILLRRLASEKPSSKDLVALEVVAYQSNRIVSVHQINPNEALNVTHHGRIIKLVELKERGEVRIAHEKGLALKPDLGDRGIVPRALGRAGYRRVFLAREDAILIKAENIQYLVRFRKVVALPKSAPKPLMDKTEKKYLGISFALLFVIMGTMIAGSSSTEASMIQKSHQFAEITLPTPPKVEEPPQEEVKQVEVEKVVEEKKHKKMPKKKIIRPIVKNTPKKPVVSQKTKSLLASLRRGGPAAPYVKINTVKAAGGHAQLALFTSATNRKLPGMTSSNSLTNAIDLKNARLLTNNADYSALKGHTEVRGRVDKSQLSKLQQQGGHLDRSEVVKVVRAGLAQIQQCYERVLAKKPGIAGKLVLEWVIEPNGRVSSTSIPSSSLSDVEVASCVRSTVSSWTFAKPTGGSVRVKFPFVFRAEQF